MIPLTDEENKYYEKQKECHICKKEFCTNENNENEFKLYKKVRDHCHYTGKFREAAHNICNLRYKVPKKIPVAFQNGSTYDYHFIIKQLPEEYEGQFEYLGENTEKHIHFSVPIKKEVANGREEEDDDSKKEKDDNCRKEDDNSKKCKAITYRIKFINSYRFMQSKLSELVDNLSGIYNKECKSCVEKKKSNQNAILLALKIID